MDGVCERLLFLSKEIITTKKREHIKVRTFKMDEIWHHFHIGDFDVRKKFIQMHFSFNFQTLLQRR